MGTVPPVPLNGVPVTTFPHRSAAVSLRESVLANVKESTVYSLSIIAIAALSVTVAPQELTPGEPLRITVSGLPAGAVVTGRFLDRDLTFLHAPARNTRVGFTGVDLDNQPVEATGHPACDSRSLIASRFEFVRGLATVACASPLRSPALGENHHI